MAGSSPAMTHYEGASMVRAGPMMIDRYFGVTASGSNGATVPPENATLGSPISVSNAKRGSRNIIPITGGTTTGKVAGKILNGGADYQLAGSSDTTLDARYTLNPSNGEFNIVRGVPTGTA